MASFFYLLYTSAHVALFLITLRLGQPQRTLAGWIILIVTAGLIFDNAVLAAGRLIGIGQTLELLSYTRFALHVFLTPLLCLAAWDFGRRGGVPWLQRRSVQAVFLASTLGLIGLGMAMERSLQLAPFTIDGVLRYRPLEAVGPPLPAIGTTLALIAAGVGLWRVRGWFWLLVASVVMFVGSAAAANLLVVGSGFEVLFLSGIVATEYALSQGFPAASSVRSLKGS